MGKIDQPITFGEWLKRLRNAKDLTLEELAQRVGYSVYALLLTFTGLVEQVKHDWRLSLPHAG